MGPTWVPSAPDGPHVGPMKLVISDELTKDSNKGASFSELIGEKIPLDIENVMHWICHLPQQYFKCDFLNNTNAQVNHYVPKVLFTKLKTFVSDLRPTVTLNADLACLRI